MGFFSALFNLFKKPASAVPATPAAPTNQPTPLTPSTSPRKVLVVEDDLALRTMYVELLTKAGFTMSQAANGEIGLATLKEQKPDIVILDLNMPVMDGKEMLHTLREIPEFKFLPVIVLTNSGDVDNIRQTNYDNASEFLIKSNIEPDALINKIKTFV